MKTYTVTFCRGLSHSDGPKQFNYAAGTTHHGVPASVVAVLRSITDRSDTITEEPAEKAQPARSQKPDVPAEPGAGQ
jgi:hypothetical protein